MNFVYHKVPEGMQGHFLYPLNQLKTKYPKIYKERAKKYSERKHVFKKEIPSLNCKWLDVIHLIAVSPQKITKALNDAGHKTQKLKWYKIPIDLLNPDKTTIYKYKFKKDLSQVTARDQFTKFSASKLSKYNKIPKRTISHYKEEAANNRHPLTFHFIPHVLYKGKIDISTVEIIEA